MYRQAPVPCTTWTCNPVVLPAATLSCRHRFRSRTRTITRRPTAHPRCPRLLVRFTPALIYAKDHICPAAEPTPAAKPMSHVTSALPHSPVNNTKSVHPLPSLISCLVYHLLSLVASFSFISCLSSHFIMHFSYYSMPKPFFPFFLHPCPVKPITSAQRIWPCVVPYISLLQRDRSTRLHNLSPASASVHMHIQNEGRHRPAHMNE